MVYIRLAAAAALAASLAGCSFFDASDRGPKFQESGGPDPAWPAQSLRLATLPGYLSNEDTVPDQPTGFVGIPARRPQPAAAPVLLSQPRRVLTFADLVAARHLRAPEPMGTPLRAESYTLADLIEDQAWRQRTSRQLERLFQ